MAIVLNTEASNDSSVSSEMVFVAYEATKAIDPVTYPDYRYVCDVYVGGVFTGRLKARPDPEFNRGIFDVSKILRGSAAYGLNVSAQTVDYTVRGAYQLKFGEEYGDTLYTNLLVDSSDRYFYETYKPKPFTSSAVLANGPATSRPRQSYSYQSEDYLLVPYFANVTGVNTFDIEFRDSSGGVISSQTISQVGQAAHTIRTINVNANTPSNAVRVALTMPYVAGPAGANYFIDYLCTKYPVYTLAWLNRYGAYESNGFGLKSKKSVALSRKEFEQLDYRINSSGILSYQENNVYYGSKRTFSTNVKTKLKLASHLLNSDEYDWLADLFISPDVYLYDGSKFLPVKITSDNYEYKTYLNSKLSALEFEVELTGEYNSQQL